MTYIFVDTNIFLHYKFFVEIPWNKLFGSPYQIVLAPVVVDEMDKHKRNSNSKTAARAKQVLSRFEQIVKSPDSYPLLCLTKRPSLDTFKKFQLDRQEQDDAILATIIEFGEQHPDEMIIFVSNDTGPRFRASSLGIKSDQLPDDLQNSIEPSEEQKLIKQLTQENNKLKNAIPKLAICFDDDTTIYKYKINHYVESEQDYVTSHYQKILKDYPLLNFEDPKEKNEEIKKKIDASTSVLDMVRFMGQQDRFGLNNLSETQVTSYNSKLESFYNKYEEFLKKKYKFKKVVALTLPIDIKMSNKGNAPAANIDIWLHFPDGFKLLNNNQFPSKPKKPEPPYRPKNRFDFAQANYPILPNLSHLSRSYPPPEINLNKPEIRQTNSYEVDIHFKSLKHFHSVAIDPMLVIYSSLDKIINFTIDYKITANNIPEPVFGKLSVVTEID